MRRTQVAALLTATLCASPLAAGARFISNQTSNAVETVNWTSGVSYRYDGSGNVRRIGNDEFVYDKVGRLVRATVNGRVRTYQYDAFGNRVQCIHEPDKPERSDCQDGFEIDSRSNQVKGVTYDAHGNVTALGGHIYTYDAASMARRHQFGAFAREYVYTAADERIGTHHVGSAWEWTVRDESGKVLREFTSAADGTSQTEWKRDYVYRSGQLLASRHLVGGMPVTYRYHLDHLGTARRVTDDSDLTVGFHDYYAFGQEVSGGQTESFATSLRYTGHERDQWGSDSLGTLDYMHARYYSPALGRFLSIDPVFSDRSLLVPQGWNRYSYVLNNPLIFVDPDGRQYRCFPVQEGTQQEPKWQCVYTLEIEVVAPRSGPGPGGGGGGGGGGIGQDTYRYETLDEAALAAIGSICSESTKLDREFGGVIYESGGRFGFSTPRMGYKHSMKGILGTNSVWGADAFMGMLPPPGVRMVGTYHTHGAYSRGYADEAISDNDKLVSMKLGIAGYVGTPGGRVLKYTPREGMIRSPNAFDLQIGKVPCK